MQTVKTWMSARPLVAQPTTTLPEARQLLAERTIRRLPVVSPEGHLLGLVTEGDINRISDSPDSDLAEYNLYYRVRDLPLSEFMRQPVITVTPDTPLSEAAHLLITWHIHGMPVVERGQVVGVITVSDLLRAMVSSQTQATPLDELVVQEHS